MKRDFLKNLGLEKEQIEKIMAENGKDIEKAKSEHETLKIQLDLQTQQIEDWHRQLELLKDGMHIILEMREKAGALLSKGGLK